MRRRRNLHLLLGAAVASVLGTTLVVAPTAAQASPAAQSAVTPAVHAYEWDTAVSGTPPTWDSDDCAYQTGSTACFQVHGDVLWVADVDADGHSATISWKNYLTDASGNPVLYRQGSCVNKLSAGKWGKCDKDFYEDSTYPNAENGQGSTIEWDACVYDSDSGKWYGCSEYGEWTENDG